MALEKRLSQMSSKSRWADTEDKGAPGRLLFAGDFLGTRCVCVNRSFCHTSNGNFVPVEHYPGHRVHDWSRLSSSTRLFGDLRSAQRPERRLQSLIVHFFVESRDLIWLKTIIDCMQFQGLIYQNSFAHNLYLIAGLGKCNYFSFLLAHVHVWESQTIIFLNLMCEKSGEKKKSTFAVATAFSLCCEFFFSREARCVSKNGRID